MIFNNIPLLPPTMELDLVNLGCFQSCSLQPLELLYPKVRDANRACETLVSKFEHCRPNLKEVATLRIVDQEQVNIVCAQTLKRSVKSGPHLFRTAVLVRLKLGGDEHIRAEESCLTNSRCNVFLVFVGCRSVNVPVACKQCCNYSISALAPGLAEERAQPELWDLHTPAKLHIRAKPPRASISARLCNEDGARLCSKRSVCKIVIRALRCSHDERRRFCSKCICIACVRVHRRKRIMNGQADAP
mmetsp:Transcript_16886/g.43714  ORF Transcript_16886/g.43714 Transcript_16886/m.43714 type:complete len:245 (-) Transcript_16886:87-821(-)